MKEYGGYSVDEWKMAGIVFAVLLAVGAGLLLWRLQTPEQAARTVVEKDQKRRPARAGALGPGVKATDKTALAVCQQAIRQVAAHPESVDAPDVEPLHGPADWRFAWNRDSHMIQWKNELGHDEAVSALCVVDEATVRIRLLAVDGKQWLGVARN